VAVAVTAAAIAFGGTSTALATPATASAHPAARTDQGSAVTKGRAGHTVTSKMTRVRVTKLVTSTPDRAGNVKVLLANGKTVPIPAADRDRVMRRAAQQAKIHPDGTVYSDCGSSYITLEEKPDGYPVAIRTGFHIDEPAIAYNWLATVTGTDDYLHEYSSGGSLFFRHSWDGGFQSDEDLDPGLFTASVHPFSSFAVLATDDLCFSGGPEDEAYLGMKPCLDAEPTGAVSNGSGWVSYTTAPVPHRNKDIHPLGRAGTRASQATACLTNDHEVWTSNAGGNITGWQDAKKKARDNGLNPNGSNSPLARCHVIAAQLGGLNIARNLAPCWQDGVNVGDPNSMRDPNERKVRAAADSLAPGDAISYVVTPNYATADSTIPTSFFMQADIQYADGTTEPVINTVVVNEMNISGTMVSLGN
jgi:hypothetical protein